MNREIKDALCLSKLFPEARNVPGASTGLGLFFFFFAATRSSIYNWIEVRTLRRVRVCRSTRESLGRSNVSSPLSTFFCCFHPSGRRVTSKVGEQMVQVRRQRKAAVSCHLHEHSFKNLQHSSSFIARALPRSSFSSMNFPSPVVLDQLLIFPWKCNTPPDEIPKNTNFHRIRFTEKYFLLVSNRYTLA